MLISVLQIIVSFIIPSVYCLYATSLKTLKMSAVVDPNHLIVLCHGTDIFLSRPFLLVIVYTWFLSLIRKNKLGLNGDYQELSYLERKIVEISADVVVLNSKENSGNLSKAGILVCAELLVSMTANIVEFPCFNQINYIQLARMI